MVVNAWGWNGGGGGDGVRERPREDFPQVSVEIQTYYY